MRRWAPLAILLAAMAVAFALAELFFDLDPDRLFEAMREHRALLLSYVESHRALAMAAFVAIYTLVIAVSLPVGAVMTITGGFLFGVLEGSLCVVFAATLGATIIFLVARTSLGEPLRARARPWHRALELGFRRNAFWYLLSLRLVPLFPFVVVNLVPAFLGVSVGTYVAATALGIVPAVVVFSLFGAGLGSILDSGEGFSVDSVLTSEIVAALCGLALLALAPAVHKKIRARRQG